MLLLRRIEGTRGRAREQAWEEGKGEGSKIACWLTCLLRRKEEEWGKRGERGEMKEIDDGLLLSGNVVLI